jgi:hypothetical protein
MENDQAKFEGWAIVELMGHQREAGFVTTEAYGQAVLFRVDVPEIPEREEILLRDEWNDRSDNGIAAGSYLRAGSKVLRVKIAPRSRLISPSAIYAINPCTEEAVRKVVGAVPRTLILLEAPRGRSLVAGQSQLDEDEGERELSI